MNKGINLLRGRQTGQLEKQKKIIKILRIAAGVSLFVVVFISTVFFYLSATSSLPILQKKQTELSTTLSGMHSRVAKLLLTQTRVQDIAKIIDERSNFDETITEVAGSIPQDVTVDVFTLDKKNIVMTVKSGSLLSIDTMLNKFVNLTAEQKFLSKVTVSQLITDPKLGYYTISVSLDLL